MQRQEWHGYDSKEYSLPHAPDLPWLTVEPGFPFPGARTIRPDKVMEFFPESAEARLQRHSGRYNAVRNPFHAEGIFGYRTNRGCSAEPYLPEEPGSRYMESRYRGHILEVDINEK